MGIVFCNNFDQKLEEELEVAALKSKNSENEISNSLELPKEFLDKLSMAKVVLVSNVSKSQTANTVQEYLYDLPEGFFIPQELCIEHEKGVPLVILILFIE